MAGKKIISPDDVFAGERLRALRIERGLSQSALGERAGVTFQQVQKYEKGANRMTVGRVVHFAQILGVPVTDLLPSSRLVEGKAVHVLERMVSARAYSEIISNKNVRDQMMRLIEAIDMALGAKKKPPLS